jgi:hypothetical protein
LGVAAVGEAGGSAGAACWARAGAALQMSAAARNARSGEAKGVLRIFVMAASYQAGIGKSTRNPAA